MRAPSRISGPPACRTVFVWFAGLMILGCSSAQSPSPEAASRSKSLPAPSEDEPKPQAGSGASEITEDPFAAGADALAVSEPEVGQSLRPKLAMQRLRQGEVVVEVRSVDDTRFPRCVLLARVLRTGEHRSTAVRQRLGRGRTYRFVARISMREGEVDLADPATRRNLGLCYYPAETRLALEVTGVDLDARIFRVGSVRHQ